MKSGYVPGLKFKIKNLINDCEVISYRIKTRLSEIPELKITVSVNGLKSESLIGKHAELELEGNTIFSGYIDRLQFKKEDESIVSIVCLSRFQTLKYNIRCRVYSEESLSSIIETVLKKYDIEYSVKCNYGFKTVLCQYNESDYNFLCRIMAKYSMGFFVKTSNDKLFITSSPSYLSTSTEITKRGSTEHYSVYYDRVKTSGRKPWSVSMSQRSYSTSKSSNFGSTSLFFTNAYEDEDDLKELASSFGSKVQQFQFEYNTVCLSAFAGCVINKDEVVYETELSTESGLKMRIITKNKEYVCSPDFNEAQIPHAIHGFVGSLENIVSVDSKDYLKVYPVFDTGNYVLARVTNLWSGRFYGSRYIPRDGMEIVFVVHDTFMSSCSIVGCCYNDSHRPAINSNFETGIVSGTYTDLMAGLTRNALVMDDTPFLQKVTLEGKKDISIHCPDNMSLRSTFYVNESVDRSVKSNIERVNVNISSQIFDQRSITSQTTQHTATSQQDLINNWTINNTNLTLTNAVTTVVGASVNVIAPIVIITGVLTFISFTSLFTYQINVQIPIIPFAIPGSPCVSVFKQDRKGTEMYSAGFIVNPAALIGGISKDIILPINRNRILLTGDFAEMSSTIGAGPLVVSPFSPIDIVLDKVAETIRKVPGTTNFVKTSLSGVEISTGLTEINLTRTAISMDVLKMAKINLAAQEIKMSVAEINSFAIGAAGIEIKTAGGAGKLAVGPQMIEIVCGAASIKVSPAAIIFACGASQVNISASGVVINAGTNMMINSGGVVIA